MDEPLRRRIKDLWAFGSMADERVRELGTAVLATDAPRAALTLMDREIDAALDALGPLRDSPGPTSSPTGHGAWARPSARTTIMPAKGYSWSDAPRLVAADPAPGLPRWEALAIDAVGNVIEFWGFKHNQGRIWAVLYLRGMSMTATQLEEELGLSKGAVSMLVRDLERWGVVVRIRQPGTGAWHFRAETDLVQMVRRVVQERETAFITRIRANLEEARRLAAASGWGASGWPAWRRWRLSPPAPSARCGSSSGRRGWTSPRSSSPSATGSSGPGADQPSAAGVTRLPRRFDPRRSGAALAARRPARFWDGTSRGRALGPGQRLEIPRSLAGMGVAPAGRPCTGFSSHCARSGSARASP
jgi:DNA-binding MarR family transcriptional regulator